MKFARKMQLAFCLIFPTIGLTPTEHDLLLEYALSQLKDGEEQEARLKHASYYKNVLSSADDLYLQGGDKVLMGLRLFDLEWEHIRAGQALAAATKNTNQLSSQLCIAYPDAGVYVLSLRQHPRDKIEWLEAAISAAREIGDRRGEGNALFNMGFALYGLEEKERAIDLVKQALKIYEAIESPAAERARNSLNEWGAVK